MRLVLFVIVAACLASNVSADEGAAQSAGAPAAPVARPAIEVTFGSAQLFNHQSIIAKDGRVERQVIPVTSALLMFEWLFHDRFSAISLFNLPLGTQKTVVDGQSRDEYVAPSLALGLRAAAVRLDVFAASRLELQIAALGGVTIGSSAGDAVFPLAAARLHFVSQRDSPCTSVRPSPFARTPWACSTESATASDSWVELPRARFRRHTDTRAPGRRF